MGRSLALLVLCAPAVAFAHNPGVLMVRPRTDVRVDIRVAIFDFGGATGNVVSLIGGGDYELSRRVTIGGQLPFHVINTDQEGGWAGIGDLSQYVSYQLVTRDDLWVAARVALEVPIGDDERALGSRHVDVGPGLAVEYHTREWVVTGAAGYSHTIGDRHYDPVLVDGEMVPTVTSFHPIDPHDKRQVEVAGGVAYAPSWYLGVAGLGEVPVIDHEGPAMRLTATLETGALSQGVWFRGSVAAGLTDDRPFTLRVVMTAEWPLK